jgi:hypothetical protein
MLVFASQECSVTQVLFMLVEKSRNVETTLLDDAQCELAYATRYLHGRDGGAEQTRRRVVRLRRLVEIMRAIPAHSR